MELVLGIDGGGTSCRAALATAAGKVLGRATSGPANIMSDLEGARDNIVEAARRACIEAGMDPELLSSADAVLGLAGTNVGDYAQRLKAILPFRRSVVENDALIALNGALGAHDGAIAIIGTGTAFMSRKGGRIEAIGGWGFLLGDRGSGARIGRDLLEVTLLAHDRIRPATAVTDAVLERFGGDPREIVSFAARARPGEFGAFAPLVFEHAERGDAVAQKVLDSAVSDIEEAVAALELEGDQRLCLLGGLSGLFSSRLSEPHRSRLKPPLQDALGGAVSMAVDLFHPPAQDGRHG